jgi:hypothetical protein
MIGRSDRAGSFFNKKTLATVMGGGVGVTAGAYTTGAFAAPWNAAFLPVMIGGVLGVLATGVIAKPMLEKAHLVFSSRPNRLMLVSFLIAAAATTLGSIIGLMLTSLVVSLTFNPFTFSAMLSAGISAGFLIGANAQLNTYLSTGNNLVKECNPRRGNAANDNDSGDNEQNDGVEMQDFPCSSNNNVTMRRASSGRGRLSRNRADSIPFDPDSALNSPPNDSSKCYTFMQQSTLRIKFAVETYGLHASLEGLATIFVDPYSDEYATVHCSSSEYYLDVYTILSKHNDILEINGKKTAIGELVEPSSVVLTGAR